MNTLAHRGPDDHGTYAAPGVYTVTLIAANSVGSNQISRTVTISALARGEMPRPGPQIDRQTSCPEGGPTTLKKMAERNYDYRGQW